MCDNKFHTEHLAELLEDDEKFGFLIMDGNGSLYGTVQGCRDSCAESEDVQVLALLHKSYE